MFSSTSESVKAVIGWSVKMFKKKFLAAMCAVYIFLSPFTSSTASAVTFDKYYRDKNTVDTPFGKETAPDENYVNTKKFEPAPQEGEGLEFLVYDKNGVMAFALIAAHENYKVRPVIARNRIQGRATLSQMTADYNDIAMINASYFEPNGNLIGIFKIDNVIVGSEYMRRSAIGINSDGSVIFGQIEYEGIISINGNEFEIGGVNCDRIENSIVVYNNKFGATTNTNNYGVEIIVRNGAVAQIIRGKGNNYIPPDGYIISAHTNAAGIFNNVQVGDTVNFYEDLVDADDRFDRAVHVIGAGPRLITDGRITVTADEEKFPSDIRVGRAPRSAFGVTKYGDYIFAVVDGRQSHSRGCTLYEWADILLNQFGAVNAINLDGGGSTELIVKDSVVNSPSDGNERPVASALMIIPR